MVSKSQKITIQGVLSCLLLSLFIGAGPCLARSQSILIQNAGDAWRLPYPGKEQTVGGEAMPRPRAIR